MWVQTNQQNSCKFRKSNTIDNSSANADLLTMWRTSAFIPSSLLYAKLACSNACTQHLKLSNICAHKSSFRQSFTYFLLPYLPTITIECFSKSIIFFSGTKNRCTLQRVP